MSDKTVDDQTIPLELFDNWTSPDRKDSDNRPHVDSTQHGSGSQQEFPVPYEQEIITIYDDTPAVRPQIRIPFAPPDTQVIQCTPPDEQDESIPCGQSIPDDDFPSNNTVIVDASVARRLRRAARRRKVRITIKLGNDTINIVGKKPIKFKIN